MWGMLISGLVFVFAAAAAAFGLGVYQSNEELQHLAFEQQERVIKLEKIKSLNPADVCPGWWFGTGAKDLTALRSRMCGK